MNNDEYARLSHSDEGWCGPKCFKEALPFFDSSDLSLADIQDTSELDSSPPRPSRHNRSRLSSSLVYSTPTAKVFLLIWIRFEPLLLPKLPILSLLSRPGPMILSLTSNYSFPTSRWSDEIEIVMGEVFSYTLKITLLPPRSQTMPRLNFFLLKSLLGSAPSALGYSIEPPPLQLSH